jgi:hypothetical protein
MAAVRLVMKIATKTRRGIDTFVDGTENLLEDTWTLDGSGVGTTELVWH